MSLKSGQAIQIRDERIWNAAKEEQSSLLFNSISQRDVDNFVKKISSNWDVSIIKNDFNYSYTIIKN